MSHSFCSGTARQTSEGVCIRRHQCIACSSTEISTCSNTEIQMYDMQQSIDAGVLHAAIQKYRCMTCSTTQAQVYCIQQYTGIGLLWAPIQWKCISCWRNGIFMQMFVICVTPNFQFTVAHSPSVIHCQNWTYPRSFPMPGMARSFHKVRSEQFQFSHYTNLQFGKHKSVDLSSPSD